MLNGPESIYQLLPAYIRQRDAHSGAPLQQLLAIIDAQAQMIDRDLLRMYDNWFIETCEPWVVPYIAELLGHEPMAGAGQAAAEVLAPRREVANSIAFARRKGTLLVLEALARDVASWPAVAVEFYRRLVQAQHLDHLHPERPGTADLRDAARLDRIDSPFDTLSRTGDVRRIGNPQSVGRYNPGAVGLFVFRQRCYSVTQTFAGCEHEVGLHCYAFSVLGNDVGLYRKPEPPALLPLPIRRRELEADATPDARPAQADPRLYGEGASLSITVRDWPKKGEHGTLPAARIIPADLSSWSYRVPKNHVAVDPQLGRIMFPHKQRPAERSVRVSYHYGFPMDLGGGEYARVAMPLPLQVERIRVRAEECDAAADSIGQVIARWQTARAGPEERRPHAALVVELADSGSYRGLIHILLGQGESVWIIAAPGVRPVLTREERDGAAYLVSVHGAAGSRLALDGLLIAGHGIEIAPHGQECSDSESDMCQVWIRHSTLVPGGGLSCDCRPTHPSRPGISLDGSAARLRLDHSIVGPVQVGGAARAAPITVNDSIIDATDGSLPAIADAQGDTARAVLTVARSTIIGAVTVHAIERAEDSLFFGSVTVARKQTGCIRYCYIPPGSRTPRRHRCQPDAAVARARAGVDADMTLTPRRHAAHRERVAADAVLRVRPHFESLHYGSGEYARLHPSCATEIATGAHDGAEMGVYHDLFEPQRLALLNARLADHVPATFDAATLCAAHLSPSSHEAHP
jgi:hypothetical protein